MALGNPITLTDNVASKIISAIATDGQTSFTVTGGYRINAISVYRNGVRLVDNSDFTATDGASVTLLSGATLGDTIEFQIFDDFRVADAIVSNKATQTISGNLNITGDLTVGIVTGGTYYGNGANLTGIDTTSLKDSGGVVRVQANTSGTVVSGMITATTGDYSGNVTIGGTLTYEDVTNIDSVGIITARTGVRVTDGGVIVTAGVSTFSANIDANAGLDVDGHAELDDVNIAGVSTFSNDVNINGITVGRGGGDIASNIAFGLGASNATSTGSNNIAIGQNALYSHTSGLDNIAIGFHCLFDVEDGNYNVAMGRRTGQDLTGSYNVALGQGALYYSVGINSCVAVGYEAGARFARGLNVTLPYLSAHYVTGSNNTILGP